jgi:tight adherence protein B
MPGAIDAVARALRSGASLHAALHEAAAATPGPLGEELAAVAREGDEGLVAALDRWAGACPRPEVRLVAAALAMGAETGGAQARAVEGVAAALRQRAAVQAEARALATQARVSAQVMAGAPIAFGALSWSGNAARFLVHTRAGLVCLFTGLALDGLGAWWMARIVRIAS